MLKALILIVALAAAPDAQESCTHEIFEFSRAVHSALSAGVPLFIVKHDALQILQDGVSESPRAHTPDWAIFTRLIDALALNDTALFRPAFAAAVAECVAYKNAPPRVVAQR